VTRVSTPHSPGNARCASEGAGTVRLSRQGGRPARWWPALAALVSGAICGHRAAGQTFDTAGAFWPALDVHAELGPALKLLAFGELKTDEDFPHRQASFGAALSYRASPILTPHRINNDTDKEHYFVGTAGYEHLETIQSGVDQFENRVILAATPRYRPLERFLLADRNRVEFRWVGGDYSTRYRNRFTAEYDADTGGFAFTPYASAEFFFDITKSDWNEEQYAAGLMLPYKRILTVDLYYLRQNCPGCSPQFLNVFGLTVNVYFDLGR
jgi:hypothetical protein